MSENIVITALKEGKHEAYEELFTLLYVPLCNYAYSILKDEDDADDIVQKTFCTLWDRRATLEIKTSVKSYLYRIIHNECMNRIRQLKIRTEHDRLYFERKNSKTNEVEEDYFGSELEVAIRKAIDELPPRCREVFLKSRMDSLSYAEIASEMNISVNTVENQMAKALRLLRESLKDYMMLFWLLFYFYKN